MTPKEFTDNHLINFTSDQLDEIFDWDEVKKLPSTEIEKNRIFLLSQFLVGNVSEPFDEIKRQEKSEQRRIFLTWLDVVKDSQTLKSIGKSIVMDF